MEEPTMGLIGEEDGEFANVLRSILSMQMEAEGPLPANIAEPTRNVHVPPNVGHNENCALLEQYVSELLPCVKLVGNSSGLNLEERKQAIKFAADAGMAKRATASQPTPLIYGWTQALTEEVLTMADAVEHSVESTAAGGGDVVVTSSDSEECSSTSNGINAIFASKEKVMMYRVASMRPVVADTWLRKEVELSRPKRRNVRISKEPQTVAARKRRERIGDRIRMLQRLVPGSTKLDTASMLDEAVHYLKFLKMEVQALHNTFIQLNNTPTTTTTTITTSNHTPYSLVFPMNTNPMNIDPSQPTPIATTSFDPHMGLLMPNCPTLPPFSSFDPNHLQQSCH